MFQQGSNNVQTTLQQRSNSAPTTLPQGSNYAPMALQQHSSIPKSYAHTSIFLPPGIPE